MPGLPEIIREAHALTMAIDDGHLTPRSHHIEVKRIKRIYRYEYYRAEIGYTNTVYEMTEKALKSPRRHKSPKKTPTTLTNI